jgi:hypothetical protein
MKAIVVTDQAAGTAAAKLVERPGQACAIAQSANASEICWRFTNSKVSRQNARCGSARWFSWI